jgi:hypothetical protein
MGSLQKLESHYFDSYSINGYEGQGPIKHYVFAPKRASIFPPHLLATVTCTDATVASNRRFSMEFRPSFWTILQSASAAALLLALGGCGGGGSASSGAPDTATVQAEAAPPPPPPPLAPAQQPQLADARANLGQQIFNDPNLSPATNPTRVSPATTARALV